MIPPFVLQHQDFVRFLVGAFNQDMHSVPVLNFQDTCEMPYSEDVEFHFLADCHGEVGEVRAIPCRNAESSGEANGFTGVLLHPSLEVPPLRATGGLWAAH